MRKSVSVLLFVAAWAGGCRADGDARRREASHRSWTVTRQGYLPGFRSGEGPRYVRVRFQADGRRSARCYRGRAITYSDAYGRTGNRFQVLRLAHLVDRSDPRLRALAESLVHGYPQDREPEVLAWFVQSFLPYVSDGNDEIVRDPHNTLAHGGDCEDLTLAYVALAAELGHRTAIFQLLRAGDTGHVMPAVPARHFSGHSLYVQASDGVKYVPIEVSFRDDGPPPGLCTPPEDREWIFATNRDVFLERVFPVNHRTSLAFTD